MKKEIAYRPYLVVPKLIEQPTWGGQYMAGVKGWLDRQDLDRLKIGQSYELFSGSNLSLCDSSLDPKFVGEVTDRDAVQVQTHPENTISLTELTEASPEKALGEEVVKNRGPRINILVKYTQALGNSFQVHIKADVVHEKWKSKPESWYYFEPGLITLGVKPGINWADYENAVRVIDKAARTLGELVSTGKTSYDEAKKQLDEIIAGQNPWQYVNMVEVEKDQLIDLSGGGLHHSWEEDSSKIPLGNVLYELQSEQMDDISTFRNFDKGKMGNDGSVRKLHIKEYFEFIDRSDETNNPANHVRQSKILSEKKQYKLENLLVTPLYNMDKLTICKSGNTYETKIKRFKHLFVKSGSVKVTASDRTILVTVGHSCFVPAAVNSYSVQSLDDDCQILISY